MSVGIFAVVVFGYLAAVYLTLQTHDAEERAAFRKRALMSGVVVGGVAATVLVLAGRDVRNSLLTSA